MSKPNQLFLLADHIKLSLLERERARSLNLDNDTQDGHISRSLDQFREGLEALQEEQKRLTENGDDSAAQTIADALPSLQKQFADLSSKFQGDTSAQTTKTLRHPNDASLAPDFAHAQSTKPQPRKANLRSSSSSAPASAPASAPTPTPSTTKVVRFSDSPLPGPKSSSPLPPPDDDPDRAALFGPYRDDPSADGEGYRDVAGTMDNQQVHAYHARILEDQDEHLDRLGESIGRQRELSMQIGDELDAHVAMLDDVEAATDRHQGRLDRARRSLGRIARASGESKQMATIIALIIILVLLIAILK
ncbi:hypothetical protein SODALDRAFT_271209 [Sodiomyces alkalinus F11]|uniref:t-SNARE coiled-coil homology domain-containing protein n=1 Tax=Sodiomyces alkalinus (strain CBS 110278 / VKM F-3762 / F11) TaxID=1314773 RepID=A0A3N2Q130_SODAK|nr:hypothetical protein SODALDRAFT_271209 [Sodiomyces alkalinus F11]ROT40325.1 hypothetical protein SODALDRAFT_271209 [Sodiomyces alkalinus F11]